MKIIDLETEQHRLPLLNPYTTAERTLTEVSSLFLRLTDDQGRVGWGEAVANLKVTGDSWAALEPLIRGPLAEICLGADPTEYEDLCRRVEHSMVGNPGARAAVDVALHDLRARQLGIPLHRFLGAGTDRIATAASVPTGPIDVMVRQAVGFHQRGFRIIKVKVGRPGSADVDAVREIAGALPAGVRIWLDANQGWSAKHAIWAVDRMERAGVEVEVLEQPVPAADIDGLALVTDRVRAEVIADESVLTPADVLDLIRRGAADGFTVKITKVGGIRPARRIVALAEAAGRSCMVSTTAESVLGVTAAAMLAASAPHVIRYADLDAVLWLGRQPLAGGVRYDNGELVLPAEPGLAVRAHSASG